MFLSALALNVPLPDNYRSSLLAKHKAMVQDGTDFTADVLFPEVPKALLPAPPSRNNSRAPRPRSQVQAPPSRNEAQDGYPPQRRYGQGYQHGRGKGRDRHAAAMAGPPLQYAPRQPPQPCYAPPRQSAPPPESYVDAYRDYTEDGKYGQGCWWWKINVKDCQFWSY